MYSYPDKRILLNQIENLRDHYPGGTTNTQEALKVLQEDIFGPMIFGDRRTAPNFAIIITDGLANEQAARTVPMAESAKQAGIEIVAVGVTSEVDEHILRQISSAPQIEGENFFIAPDFDELEYKIERIVRQACNVDDRPPAPIPDCAVPFDIVFIVDGSASLCDTDPSYDANFGSCDHWMAVLEFIEDIVRVQPIGGELGTQVGLIIYSTTATVEWYLDEWVVYHISVNIHIHKLTLHHASWQRLLIASSNGFIFVTLISEEHIVTHSDFNRTESDL